MKRLALILLAVPALAGTITCSATCLSKIASIVSVAANAKTLVAGTKRVGRAVGVVRGPSGAKGASGKPAKKH